MSKFGVEETLAWIELGERLSAANPRRYAKLKKLIGELVEQQELLGSVPAPLRTIRSLRKRRYVA